MLRRFERNVVVSHVAFFILLASACHATDWPQFRGGQRLAGAADTSPSGLLIPVWTLRLPEVVSGSTTYPASVTASPVIATVDVAGSPRRLAFIASLNSYVYALDAATGSELWSASLGDCVESTPLVLGNVLYITPNNGRLTALNAANGAVLWTHSTGGWEDRSSPNYSGGNIVCAASYPKTTIYAVPARSADPAPEAWHLATGQFVYSSPSVDPLTENIFCGSDDGKVYALKPDGTPLWTQPFATSGGIFRASPALGNGKVYITGGDYDWTLHAINASTGALIWDAPMRPTPDPDTLPDSAYKSAHVSSAAVDGSFIAVVGGYGTTIGTSDLYAYRDNGITADLLWKAPLPNEGVGYYSSPVITPDSVVVGVTGTLDSSQPNAPAGRIYVVDRATGSAVWYASGSLGEAGGPVLASPAVADDEVVVGDTSGLVTSYRIVSAGDVDADGLVTALDAETLMINASGDGTATPGQTQRADVYPTGSVSPDGMRSFGDGRITPGDVDRVLKRAVGLEPVLP